MSAVRTPVGRAGGVLAVVRPDDLALAVRATVDLSQVETDEGSVFVAGGVESMTRAPFVMLKSAGAWSREVPPMADTTVGWRFTNPRMSRDWTISLGLTAEKVAREYGITRNAQNEFAVESQRRAAQAMRDGIFPDEIVPVTLPRKKGDPCPSARSTRLPGHARETRRMRGNQLIRSTLSEQPQSQKRGGSTSNPSVTLSLLWLLRTNATCFV